MEPEGSSPKLPNAMHHTCFLVDFTAFILKWSKPFSLAIQNA
jgi:hypothetical protein